MILEPGDANHDVSINETFHEQTDDELIEKELKQVEADDQAIQNILLGLPKDIYAAVDSCETAQEIWLRVQQMLKGSDIGIQEKKANTHIQQPQPNNNYNPQPSFTRTTCNNQSNPEDISDPTTSMNMALVLMAKAFKLKYSTPTNKNQRISSNPHNRQIAQPGMNMCQDRQMKMVGGITNQNLNGNGNVVAARAEGNAIRNNDLDEIEKVNANCILMDNLQQASTSEEQYIELLKPILEPHQVQQNDSNVIFEVSSMEQDGGTVEQHPTNVEETRALYGLLYNNLVVEVEKFNTINHKLRETNAELTTELARYKNQEKCFEISQEKYDKLERCYQKSIYQEQCLTKKINALHLSSGKQITTFNEEISNLNKQLSMEKSTVSSLLEEKKKLKSDFKIREDELHDKQIQLENKIKELDNFWLKMSQSIQNAHAFT
nr:hypothetical protein [Tanacetum cinerariifolium]